MKLKLDCDTLDSLSRQRLAAGVFIFRQSTHLLAESDVGMFDCFRFLPRPSRPTNPIAAETNSPPFSLSMALFN